MRLTLLSCVLLCPMLCLLGAAAESPQTSWRSYLPERFLHDAFPLYRVKVGARDATVIMPKITWRSPAQLPWVVYHTGAGEDCNAIVGDPKGGVIQRLLAQGFLVCTITSGPQHWGDPSGEEAHEALYHYMRATFPVRETVNLLAQSMGGTSAYPWAAHHPERVERIYGIYPITNFESMGERNPIRTLQPLVDHQIAIMHRHGLEDKAVPFEQNARQFAEAYTRLGGKIRITPVPDVGHEFSPFIFVPEEVADFFLGKIF